MRDNRDRVFEAVLYWWRSLRPVGWSEAKHLDTPQVNTDTPPEQRLAWEIGCYLRDRNRERRRKLKERIAWYQAGRQSVINDQGGNK